MKKNRVVLGAVVVVIFSLGFFVGQHADITRVVAEYTPTPSLTATPTVTPFPTVTPTPMQVTYPVALPTAGGGPRHDIIETGHISASQPVAQVGDDIGFTVTIRNQAGTKKHIVQLCFNSSDGNFGCTLDFNLYPDQSFTFNNSGRFTSGGVKTVWVTWTQDGQNFYRLVDGRSTQVTIQN